MVLRTVRWEAEPQERQPKVLKSKLTQGGPSTQVHSDQMVLMMARWGCLDVPSTHDPSTRSLFFQSRRSYRPAEGCVEAKRRQRPGPPRQPRTAYWQSQVVVHGRTALGSKCHMVVLSVDVSSRHPRWEGGSYESRPKTLKGEFENNSGKPRDLVGKLV